MITQEFLTYSKPYLIGQVADTSLSQIDSYASEGTIEFGTPVVRGTDKEKQVKKSDTKTDFLGIAVRNDTQSSGLYPDKTMVSVMTQGRVVVKVKEDAEAGSDAYVYADASIGATKAEGLKIGTFFNSATKDNLIILEIR